MLNTSQNCRKASLASKMWTSNQVNQKKTKKISKSYGKSKTIQSHWTRGKWRQLVQAVASSWIDFCRKRQSIRKNSRARRTTPRCWTQSTMYKINLIMRSSLNILKAWVYSSIGEAARHYRLKATTKTTSTHSPKQIIRTQTRRRHLTTMPSLLSIKKMCQSACQVHHSSSGASA